MDKNGIAGKLPPMLSGRALEEAMEILPDFDSEIVYDSEASRLIALSDLYSVFVPTRMSKEIYSKLYLALLRSMQKKEGILRIRQGIENYQSAAKNISGIIGGSDSFTLIGASGIGKSSAINRAVQLLVRESVIEMEKPYTKILPCVLVQCPFDSSVKGLLLEIIRVVDEQLGSKYYPKATSVSATTDMLIGTVSQLALNHIGILIVDEIQNVALSRNGRNLLGALLQLINCSGISICMVGTPECTDFFTQAMQLARRSLGLQYDSLEYGEEFEQLCSTLFRFQYVKNRSELDEATMRWLYEHSGGNVSTVVSLIHDAQEIAILDGSEALNTDTLQVAYRNRLKMLHSYIAPSRRSQTSKVKKAAPPDAAETSVGTFLPISALIQQAKTEGRCAVAYLKQYIPLEEVKV